MPVRIPAEQRVRGSGHVGAGVRRLVLDCALDHARGQHRRQYGSSGTGSARDTASVAVAPPLPNVGTALGGLYGSPLRIGTSSLTDRGGLMN